MRINANKTKAVIFNISGKIFRSEFKLGDKPIHVTESYVLFGITFMPLAPFHWPRTSYVKKPQGLFIVSCHI